MKSYSPNSFGRCRVSIGPWSAGGYAVKWYRWDGGLLGMVVRPTRVQALAIWKATVGN